MDPNLCFSDLSDSLNLLISLNFILFREKSFIEKTKLSQSMKSLGDQP